MERPLHFVRPQHWQQPQSMVDPIPFADAEGVDSLFVCAAPPLPPRRPEPTFLPRLEMSNSTLSRATGGEDEFQQSANVTINYMTKIVAAAIVADVQFYRDILVSYCLLKLISGEEATLIGAFLTHMVIRGSGLLQKGSCAAPSVSPLCFSCSPVPDPLSLHTVRRSCTIVFTLSVSFIMSCLLRAYLGTAAIALRSKSVAWRFLLCSIRYIQAAFRLFFLTLSTSRLCVYSLCSLFE
jgi:hypothetical protein